MKKTMLGALAAVLLVAILAIPAAAGNGNGNGKDGCTRIRDGVLTYSAGHYLEDQPLVVGYDPYGYNYQAHMFVGSYANSYLGRDGYPPYDGDDDSYLTDNPGAASHWAWPYRNVWLMMKWNDAWLSNKDCDDDGLLDRHYGFDGYIGSGAWLTNHMRGSGEAPDDWTYFVKIVAAPAGAYLADGSWYTAEGTEIGPAIWGSFAIIQEISNDAALGEHGVLYKSPTSAGFGAYRP